MKCRQSKYPENVNLQVYLINTPKHKENFSIKVSFGVKKSIPTLLSIRNLGFLLLRFSTCFY